MSTVAPSGSTRRGRRGRLRRGSNLILWYRTLHKTEIVADHGKEGGGGEGTETFLSKRNLSASIETWTLADAALILKPLEVQRVIAWLVGRLHQYDLLAVVAVGRPKTAWVRRLARFLENSEAFLQAGKTLREWATTAARSIVLATPIPLQPLEVLVRLFTSPRHKTIEATLWYLRVYSINHLTGPPSVSECIKSTRNGRNRKKRVKERNTIYSTEYKNRAHDGPGS